MRPPVPASKRRSGSIYWLDPFYNDPLAHIHHGGTQDQPETYVLVSQKVGQSLWWWVEGKKFVDRSDLVDKE